VEQIEIDSPSLLRHGRELFSLAPIRHLTLAASQSAETSQLAQMPELACVVFLDIHCITLHEGCRQLLHSGHLSGLRGLAIHDWPFGSAGLERLLGAPWLDQLTHLHLAATQLGPDAARKLAHCSRLDGLTALNLRGLEITLGDLRTLDASPYLRNLRRLDLWYNQLGDEGVAELIELPLIGRLCSLDLGYIGQTDQGLELLASSPILSGLRHLSLGGADRYSASGLIALGQSRHWHPEGQARVYLWTPATDEIKAEVQRQAGHRVLFPENDEELKHSDLLGWPLWRP
jgi:hypothetical protein